MGEDVTPYSIYAKFYAALSNGEKVGTNDFYFKNFSCFGETPFDEAQTIAAGIAISDYNSKNVFRTKRQFQVEFERLIV